VLIRDTVRFAAVQARVRARIGGMPSARQWEHIADAGDLASLVERMRKNGLEFWLEDVPREPDAVQLERHLRTRARYLVDWLTRQLPAHWSGTARWLAVLPDLTPLRLLLRDEEVEGMVEMGSLLHRAAETPFEQRRDLLAASTRYGALVDDEDGVEERWWELVSAALPRSRGHEGAVLDRTMAALREHLHGVRDLRRQLRQGDADDPVPGGVVGVHAQWRLRDRLAEQLRMLLAFGHPFHSVVLVLYALLEFIQFERMRALIISRDHNWAPESRFWGLQ